MLVMVFLSRQLGTPWQRLAWARKEQSESKDSCSCLHCGEQSYMAHDSHLLGDCKTGLLLPLSEYPRQNRQRLTLCRVDFHTCSTCCCQQHITLMVAVENPFASLWLLHASADTGTKGWLACPIMIGFSCKASKTKVHVATLPPTCVF